MMTMKTALIVALIFLVISPAIGQPSSALGLTPGSVAYTSGDVGLFGDFAADSSAESGMPTSDHLGLTPKSDIFACWRLGMSMECKTPEQQMELASNEMTLLKNLGYSPFEVPASDQVSIAPEKTSGNEMMPFSFYEESRKVIEPAAGVTAEKKSEAEMIFSGEGSESSVGPSAGADIPASGQEVPQKIVVPAPNPQKCQHVSLAMRPTILIGKIFHPPTIIIP
jgi:hypothetical protein